MIGGEGPCLSVGTKITLLSMATEHGQDESFPDLPIPRGLRTFLHVSIMDQHASRHRFFFDTICLHVEVAVLHGGQALCAEQWLQNSSGGFSEQIFTVKQLRTTHWTPDYKTRLANISSFTWIASHMTIYFATKSVCHWTFVYAVRFLDVFSSTVTDKTLTELNWQDAGFQLVHGRVNIWQVSHCRRCSDLTT